MMRQSSVLQTPGKPFTHDYSATLSPILQTFLVSSPEQPLSLMEDEGDSNRH